MWPAQQRRSIVNLGSVDEWVELDAPRDAMVSHPDQLAAIVLELASGETQERGGRPPRDVDAQRLV